MPQVIDDLRAAGVPCNQRGDLWQVTPSFRTPAGTVYALTYVLDLEGGRVRLALDYDGWEDCGRDAAGILATLTRLESNRLQTVLPSGYAAGAWAAERSE